MATCELTGKTVLLTGATDGLGRALAADLAGRRSCGPRPPTKSWPKLGLAVVALQLSSTQFSPRLLRNFLRDRPNQIVLSVFVGTFGYSAAGLFEVGVASGQRVDEFPRFAVTVAVVLLFVSLALLVFFADHLAHSIQVDNIMRVVEQATLRVIAQLPAGGEAAPVVPADAVAVPSRKSG